MPWTCFYNPAVKYDPWEKLLQKKKLATVSEYPTSPKTFMSFKVPLYVSKNLESLNSGDMFKYVALLFLLLHS